MYHPKVQLLMLRCNNPRTKILWECGSFEAPILDRLYHTVFLMPPKQPEVHVQMSVKTITLKIGVGHPRTALLNISPLMVNYLKILE